MNYISYDNHNIFENLYLRKLIFLKLKLYRIYFLLGLYTKWDTLYHFKTYLKISNQSTYVPDVLLAKKLTTA